MGFTLQQDDKTITGRAGESCKVTFNFESDIQGMCVEFVILTKMGTKPLIRKTFKNIVGNSIEVNLSSEELLPLAPVNEEFKGYIWGLVVHIGPYYSSIILPKLFEPAPKFLIYQGIVNCQDEVGEENAWRSYW